MDDVGGLPGVSPDAADRIILHVDNDCFYAACERLREPELIGEPVVVGMGFEAGSSSGAVATASYEAREHGVESAQPITEALERLPPVRADNPDDDGPTAHYRPVDMAFYKEQSAKVKAILHDEASTVREVSIDEAYLDCTDRTSWDAAEPFAANIRDRIEDEVGLPASIGVAPNMAVAKIASDHDKPRGLVVVRPGEVRDFLAPLPVQALHGIGPKTAMRLREDGLETVGDLADAARDDLVARFGERGREMYRRANGIDPRPIEPRGKPKSLSRESSFDEPVSDREAILERLVTLAQAVAERASQRNATYRTIGIKIVEPPFTIKTRERSLPGPVDDPTLVTAEAVDLFDEFEGRPIRKVGVRVSNLSFADGDQSSLEGWDGGDVLEETGDSSLAYGGQLSLGAFGEKD